MARNSFATSTDSTMAVWCLRTGVLIGELLRLFLGAGVVDRDVCQGHVGATAFSVNDRGPNRGPKWSLDFSKS